ncbi:MAG: hypothetical protein ABFQ53_01000 [Patescibacteria group bacterium]
MKNKNIVHGLGSALIDEKAYLFFCSESDLKRGSFTVRESEDGIAFTTITSNAKVMNINGPSDDFDECSFFHMSKDGKTFYLTYRVCEADQLCIARSNNLIDWEKVYTVENMTGNGKIVSDYLHASRDVMYVGGDALRLYASKDLENWSRTKEDLVTLKQLKKGKNAEIIVAEAQVVEDGVFVMYAVTEIDKKGVLQYEIHAVLFDYGDPMKELWRSEAPIYKAQNVEGNVSTLFGVTIFDEYFVSYWVGSDGEMFLVRHFYNHEDSVHVEKETQEESPEVEPEEEVEEMRFELERAPQNPIMVPQDEHGDWESVATYNPTAIEHDGTIHIIYRADGNDLMSVWGHASTVDGININDRTRHCIFQRKTPSYEIKAPLPGFTYTSGNNGGVGGCEDPRAVLIDGTVYVTFTAFDGWGSVRVGLTSIDLDDFVNKKWNWRETVLISPPGEMNKNWVLFPEKINGKFAVMHAFCPNILIDYFDSLDELDGKTKFINSNNTRPIDDSREWDSWFRGVGPAPLKTAYGWLVFYHAMDHRNPDRYRLGALLLDLEDPTKEICRSKNPILEPEEHYENHGHKWGVVYSCGAVIKDEQIFVYYGGADKFVCVATAPLHQFLSDLTQQREVKMLIS